MDDVYVVAGLSLEGDTRFLGYEPFHGGYPYQANGIGSAARFSDPRKAMTAIDDDASARTLSNLTDVKVYKVILEEVATKSLAEYEVDELLENISPEALKILAERLNNE